MECRTYGARPSSWADTQPFRAGLTFLAGGLSGPRGVYQARISFPGIQGVEKRSAAPTALSTPSPWARIIPQPFRAGLTFGGRPSGPRGGYQARISSLASGVEKGVPHLRRSDHHGADTQPFRAGLTFGGRPSGPRGGYQGQISSLVS